MHIRDMNLLGKIHPNTLTEFKKGHFTVRKTLNRFSAIAIDHVHEQNNKWVKGDGGVIGLTENSTELLHWTVSGLEIARIINEFQCDFNESKKTKVIIIIMKKLTVYKRLSQNKLALFVK